MKMGISGNEFINNCIKSHFPNTKGEIMKIEEKIDKICEMLKELVKLDAMDETEINQMYLQLKIGVECIKELAGE